MLAVGQHIVSHVKTADGLLEDEWVVLELLNQANHTPRVRIMVEKISPWFEKFLTCGRKYVLRQIRPLHPGHYVWAVPEKQCKATSSQVLLYDWPANEGGPSIDIDC
jgi:hypothetical protein